MFSPSACAGSNDCAGPDSHSRLTRMPCCLPPTNQGVGILFLRFFEAQSLGPLYNREREHSGKYWFGKTPLQTFLDSTHLAREKMLDRVTVGMRLTLPACALPRNGALKSGVQAQRALRLHKPWPQSDQVLVRTPQSSPGCIEGKTPICLRKPSTSFSAHFSINLPSAIR